MKYWSVAEAAVAWGVSARRVQQLLSEERVPGAAKIGRIWAIPEASPRPVDERAYRNLKLSGELRDRFARIDSLRNEMKDYRPLTPDELERIRTEFAVEYTYNSNAIEGSTLTLRETALILDGVTIGAKPLKEHLEAIGHRDAYAYIEELAANNQEKITGRIIKEIHFLVLADRPAERGKYRSTQVRILGSSHIPPEPILVPEMIDGLLAEYYAAKDQHPIERAARFHLRFEAIHPFIDGNGRTGRLLLNLMLLQSGYLPVNIKYTDRERYYDCFEARDEHHNEHPMIELLADYEQHRLEEWLKILKTAI